MKYLFLAIALAVTFSVTACGQSDNAQIADTATLTLKGQVLLRNDFEFEGERSSQGASASFIQKGETIYLLTAKHLLGPDMGISPAVKPTEFNDQLLYWYVHHNNDDENDLANIIEIVNPNNDEDEDLILLKTDAAPKNVANMVLPITQKMPALGDRLYGIGCPYSEGESCKQNIYPGTAVEISGNLIAIKADNPPDSISGFSGAALLNEKGEIVAVTYGGGEGYLVGTLLPKWLFN